MSDFFTSGKQLTMQFFKEFHEELKKEAKLSSLSTDGTVNELTSVV